MTVTFDAEDGVWEGECASGVAEGECMGQWTSVPSRNFAIIALRTNESVLVLLDGSAPNEDGVGSDAFGPAEFRLQMVQDGVALVDESGTPSYDRDEDFIGEDCGYCETVALQQIQLTP